MSKLNRLSNTHNQFQGKYKKVLCVCSAGLLRSPTAALVLSKEPYNYNTRAAGLSKDFALVIVDDFLLEWADEVVCMTLDQYDDLAGRTKKPILCLSIEDDFVYRDPDLMELIKCNYNELLGENLNEKKGI